MKKRSLSHFAYYAANRAFPVFLLLLLLLGFTACSTEKGAKALDYPAMFGETKDEVLAALDAENLTYKEDDLYANAYVLDRTETLENRDFSVYLLFRSQHRYALRLPQGPIRRKPDRCGLQAARKAL